MNWHLTMNRKYPIGIQTFSEIIRGGYVYIDKTDYLIFSMLNVYARTQIKCAGGRTDMVVWMPDVIYVFELKVNGTAKDALKQIDSKDYALPFHTDGRKVVKVGVKFNAETRVPEDWVIDNG